MSDTNPVNIILVKNGSKGDRLLFRYPFTEAKTETVTTNARTNPYALSCTLNEDNARALPSSNVSNGQLVGFSNEVLSNLFAVKTQLCRKKFELKVNDVRFVGHPTLLQTTNKPNLISAKRQTSTIILFHIVFALRANANYSVVACYHDLSYQLGVALRHEERRSGFLSRETKIMLTAHDEVAALADSEKNSAFELMLARSQLAKDLKFIFDELCSSGFVNMRINKWLQISFCLPQRVHAASFKQHTIDSEALQKCLDALRPYHAVLLLVNECELLASLPVGASPSLMRLIQVASPLKSLQEIAIDADLSITHVFQLVAHLVYWAKATIIYPLCETNVYVLAPHAPTHVSSSLVDEFSAKFPGISLLVLMGEFSLPVSLSQHENPAHLSYQQTQPLQIVIWMLQQNLLMQLHTYVYLVPTEHGISHINAEDCNQSHVHSHNKYSETSSNDTDMSINSYENGPLLNSFHFSDGFLSTLTQHEQDCILRVPAASNLEDLNLFNRLSSYFCGAHHLEEIMYYENVRRTQLLVLLDKFRQVLVTCQHEDDAVAIFYTHSKT